MVRKMNGNATLKKILDAEVLTAQKRTGKNKVFTFIYSNNFIVKGPYSKSLALSIKQRTDKLIRWGCTHIPYCYGEWKDGFLYFDNIGLEHLSSSQREKNSESFTEPPFVYDVVKQDKLVKISSLNKANKASAEFLAIPQDNYDRLIADCIKAFIVGVGDMGFFNIVYSRTSKQIYLLDIDNDRNAEVDEKSLYFFFSKAPKEVDQRKYTIPIVLQELLRVKNNFSGEEVKRADLAESILRSFMGEKREKIPLTKEIISKSSPADLGQSSADYLAKFTPLVVPPLPVSLREQSAKEEKKSKLPTKLTKKVLEEVKRKSAIRKPLSPPNRKSVIIDEKKNEKVSEFSADDVIKFGVGPHPLTPYGYKWDVIKSALQKYIRRGMVDKALFCFYEMYNVGLKNKAMMTNLFNRLRIIAVEDVGVADIQTAMSAVEKFTGEDGKSYPSFDYGQSNIIAMCSAKKTRLFSWLSGYYTARAMEGDEEGNLTPFIGDLLEKLHNSIGNAKLGATASIRTMYADLAAALYELYRYKNLSAEERKGYEEKFNEWKKKSGLPKTIDRKRSIEAFLWNEIVSVTGKGVMDEVKMLKDVFLTTSDKKGVDSEGNSIKKIADKKIFPMFACWLTMLKRIPYDEKFVAKDTVLANNTEKSIIVKGSVIPYARVELDSFVYDMHTAEGKARGMTSKDFKEEGSYVENEDMDIRQRFAKEYTLYNEAK